MVDSFGVGSEVTTGNGFWGTGFRIVLFRCNILCVPECGDGGNVLEDILCAYNQIKRRFEDLREESLG